MGKRTASLSVIATLAALAALLSACDGEFRSCRENSTCPPPAGQSGGSGGASGEGGGGAKGGSGGGDEGGSGGSDEGGSGGGGADGGSGGGACGGEDACEPKTTKEEKEACDDCGSRTRIDTCSDSCEWVEGKWSDCEQVPVCTPNESEKDPTPRACGKCGEQWRYKKCQADGCDWEPPGDYEDCAGEGVCMPEDTKQDEADCEQCGTATRTYTCNKVCEWGSPVTGTCENQGECVPDDVRLKNDVACGDCDGTLTTKETCTSQCEWSEPQEVTNCVECVTEPSLNSCNPSHKKCECSVNPNSCNNPDASQDTCCTPPEAYNSYNQCGGGFVGCDFWSCASNNDCAGGYECVDDRCVEEQ